MGQLAGTQDEDLSWGGAGRRGGGRVPVRHAHRSHQVAGFWGHLLVQGLAPAGWSGVSGEPWSCSLDNPLLNSGLVIYDRFIFFLQQA